MCECFYIKIYSGKVVSKIIRSLLLFLCTINIDIVAQTTVSRQITTNIDDAREIISTGAIVLNGDIVLGEELEAFRFQNLNIPQGAEIANAYITFTSTQLSMFSVALNIKAINHNNVPVFSSSAYNISSRSLTSASVSWSPDTWTMPLVGSYSTYNTVNLKDLVQEIINRPGWSSGNAMAFVISGGGMGKRVAYSYDNQPSMAPVLNITYWSCALLGTPVFVSGTTSSRCPVSGTVTYAASAANAGSIIYSLNSEALNAGNTINASTGQVTYVAGWKGATIITATASNCRGVSSSSHTVNIQSAPAAPVFTNTGADSTRCTASGSKSYTATSANAVISYSISNVGTGTAPTINAGSGLVSFPANWEGVSTVTATATNTCGLTRSTTFRVNSYRIRAVQDFASGSLATPLAINLTANDLCNYNNASLRIVNQPANGTIQMGVNGVVTYLPNGNFTGTDEFIYEICTGASPSTGICSQAKVTVNIYAVNGDICSVSSLPHTYYLPFPENTLQTLKALHSSASTNGTGTSTRSVISIKVNQPNTIIHYDHWEDGYELTPGSKSQSSTLVWGDGNLSNGIAPGFSNDILPEGAIITLDNTFTFRTGGGTLGSAAIEYDGRDKIFANHPLTIAKVTGKSGSTFNLQNLKTNVIDVNKFGTLFVLPFGENISNLYNPNRSSNVFKYVGVFVRAAENNTNVALDYNGDGIVDVTATLQEGQVWYYDGTGSTPGVDTDVNQANDIKSGAVLTASKPVGVDLIFGGIDNYGTRNIALLPGRYYGSTYYSPVHTTNNNAETYAVFSNVLDEPIILNWQNGAGGSGTLTIPANGYTSMEMSVSTGYKFSSANGKSYTAVTIVDAVTTTDSHDWAFNMITENELSNYTGVAWAPGMGSGGLPWVSGNYNPVWVTPVANTTVYVKYNGQISTDTGSNISPCGLGYDVALTLSALQSSRVFNPSGHQTGMSLYTCDGTKIAAVWGQDAGVAPTGSPGMDVGYVLEPICLTQLLIAYNDADTTFPNVPVTIPVLNNDIGVLDTSSVVIVENPSNGTVTVHPNGTVTYTPNQDYTGTDTFYYQVCNVGGNICDTAMVTIYIECVTKTGKNFITGKIYVDDNGNDVMDAGEEGYVHTVLLYHDINGDGFLNEEDILLQNVLSQENGTYIFEMDYTPGRSYIVVLDTLNDGKFISYPVAGLYAITFTGSESSCNRDFGLKSLFIKGTVFNDANGNTNIDGIETGTTAGTNLYVYLVDNSGIVVDSACVANDGSYLLSARSNQEYTIILSTIQYPLGSDTSLTPINSLPPAGWVTTGENGNNNNGAGDGRPDGKLVVSVGTTNIYNQNFGIQQPPLADDKSFFVNNSAFSKVPPLGFPDISAFGLTYYTISTDNNMLTGYTHNGYLTGNDTEDCPDTESCNAGSRFVLDSLYEGTLLFYNYGGETGIRMLGKGDVVPDYDPSRLVIYAVEGLGMGDKPVGFNYSIIDNAGYSSPAATYTIFTESALPVELLYFMATAEDCKVKLNWATASELHNDYFEVQRSIDVSTWVTIARIKGNGTSSARHEYNFEDSNIPHSTIYYRLKQVDVDGTAEFHKTINVESRQCKSHHQMNVYPNPASLLLAVEIQGDVLNREDRQLRLTYIDGRDMLILNQFDSISTIDVSHLSAGTYFVRIIAGKDFTDIRQIVISK